VKKKECRQPFKPAGPGNAAKKKRMLVTRNQSPELQGIDRTSKKIKVPRISLKIKGGKRKEITWGTAV